MKDNFINTIKQAQIDVMKKNNKFCIVGIEISYDKLGFKKKFPDQVFEMPVSEASINGFAVGLASRGFKPFVHHGRVEFALFGFDQIFTQGSKWNYMFGGDYPCPVSFKISLGRRQGDGPQHTDGYHSLFLQSNNLDIFIPSTPQEAYDHIFEISKNQNASVFLEHRRSYLVTQTVKKNKNQKETYNLYKSKIKNDIVIVTYGDGLIDCLLAKQDLKKYGIDFNILCINKFLTKQKVDLKLLSKISNFKNVIFFDTRPFDFGPLNSILGHLLKNNNKRLTISIISPKNSPAPSSFRLMKSYYPNKLNIIKEINQIMNLNIKVKCVLDKDYLYNFPRIDLDELIER